MDINFVIQKMMDYFNALTMKELAERIGISQQAISKWKNNNSITAIKKKCRELGIYNEIFGDIKPSSIEATKDEIKINSILLEQAKNEASKFGLDLNSYIEHLIIQDIKNHN